MQKLVKGNASLLDNRINSSTFYFQKEEEWLFLNGILLRQMGAVWSKNQSWAYFAEDR
jgi:hypothetical protein